MTSEDTKLQAALSMLRTGEATLSEVAELAGESRQLVRYWANRAKIDPGAARQAKVARMWARRIKHRSDLA